MNFWNSGTAESIKAENPNLKARPRKFEKFENVAENTTMLLDQTLPVKKKAHIFNHLRKQQVLKLEAETQ